MPIEIERNQDDIKLKADLPLLNSTQIDRDENIKVNIEKGALAQLYTKKVEQFFEAGANKDFSKISDYSDNFLMKPKMKSRTQLLWLKICTI